MKGRPHDFFGLHSIKLSYTVKQKIDIVFTSLCRESKLFTNNLSSCLDYFAQNFLISRYGRSAVFS